MLERFTLACRPVMSLIYLSFYILSHTCLYFIHTGPDDKRPNQISSQSYFMACINSQEMLQIISGLIKEARLTSSFLQDETFLVAISLLNSDLLKTENDEKLRFNFYIFTSLQIIHQVYNVLNW